MPPLGGLTAAAALSSDVVSSAIKIIAHAQAEAVSDRVQELLHAKSAELDLGYYESVRFHDTFHRAQQEAPYRPLRMVTNLFQVAHQDLPHLLDYIAANTDIAVNRDEVRVKPSDPKLFSYPFIFSTGHGNIHFSDDEVVTMRRYLTYVLERTLRSTYFLRQLAGEDPAS